MERKRERNEERKRGREMKEKGREYIKKGKESERGNRNKRKKERFKFFFLGVGILVVRASDSRLEGLGSMLDAIKYPPSTHGVRAREINGSESLVG
ncbi:hypothetical protein TNCV_3939011 [Trichonephila clavipes]|nr:hypothetical protein TNCV_3939011 [Trichonephila clavipes]